MNTYQSRITLNTESGELKTILQIRSPYHIHRMSLQSLARLSSPSCWHHLRPPPGGCGCCPPSGTLSGLCPPDCRCEGQLKSENICNHQKIFLSIIILLFNKMHSVPGGVSRKLIVTEWVIEAIGIGRGRGAFIVVIFDTRD